MWPTREDVAYWWCLVAWYMFLAVCGVVLAGAKAREGEAKGEGAKPRRGEAKGQEGVDWRAWLDWWAGLPWGRWQMGLISVLAVVVLWAKFWPHGD